MLLSKSWVALLLCVIAVAIIAGCSGSAGPRKYAYDPRILPLVGIIASAGPKWVPYADEVRRLWHRGRVYVCDWIPDDGDAWATWDDWGVLDSISIDRAFLASDRYSTLDKAAVLVVESCHTHTHKVKYCHGLQDEFYRAMWEQTQ